jgi:hypothetical protein
MTIMTSTEIESYIDGVRAALAELPTEVRDDLLEDLPSHLNEVAAEHGASLVEHLGQPDRYAAELLTAAGLAEITVAGQGTTQLARAAGQALRALAGRVDLAAGRMLAYPRLRDFVVSLQPAWWVARAWVVAQLLAWRVGGQIDVVPDVHNLVLGLLLLVAVVIASVWFGQRSRHFPIGARVPVATGSALLAVIGLFFLADVNSGYNDQPSYATAVPSAVATTAITDVYVYDKSGKLVPGARLFDQSGNPINIGDSTCNGTVQPYPDPNSYPLCPQAKGPFSGGPGALPNSSPTATNP